MASQAIIRILVEGGADPAEQEGADHHAERHGGDEQPHRHRAVVQCARIRRREPLRDDVEAGQPAEQQQMSSSRLRPKTIRSPSADTARRVGGRAASRLGNGRARTPAATTRAEIPNETASKPSVRYGSTTATTAAPATNPRIWFALKAILPTAERRRRTRAPARSAMPGTPRSRRPHDRTSVVRVPADDGRTGPPRPLGLPGLPEPVWHGARPAWAQM